MMKFLAFALTTLFTFTLSAPALAQSCNDPPGPAAQDMANSLRGLLDKRQVEFVGYTARKLASRREQPCADMTLYWSIYNEAHDLIGESKMKVTEHFSYTEPRPHYPRDLVLANREGKCEVKFDLPKPGFPQNLEITCPKNAFYHPTREAFEKVIFGPTAIDAEFVPQENVVIPVEFEIWWKNRKKEKPDRIFLDEEDAEGLPDDNQGSATDSNNASVSE